MRLLELLVEGYKEAQQEFASAVGDEQAKALIQSYKELIKKNQVPDINERNIDYWRKQGFDAFKTFVTDRSSANTKTAIKRKKVVGKSITLREDDEWLIVIPLDKSASCFHGKDSDWCTTKSNETHFETYFYKSNVTLIYCLNKLNGGMWAIATYGNSKMVEFFDKHDTSIKAEMFDAETGLDSSEIIRLANRKPHKTVAGETRDEYTKAMGVLGQLENDFKLGRVKSAEVERLLDITRNSTYCGLYIDDVYANTRRLVDVPESIITAAAPYSNFIMGKVNFKIHPESFVFDIITKSEHMTALSSILKSGYKPSPRLIQKLYKFYGNDVDKIRGFVFWLILRGNRVPDEMINRVLDNHIESDGKNFDECYRTSKMAPPGIDVQRRIVSLFPPALDTFRSLGSTIQ